MLWHNVNQVFIYLFVGWDSDMSAILLLLHLLPPSSQGRKRPGKMSAYQAVDQLNSCLLTKYIFHHLKLVHSLRWSDLLSEVSHQNNSVECVFFCRLEPVCAASRQHHPKQSALPSRPGIHTEQHSLLLHCGWQACTSMQGTRFSRSFWLSL